MENSNTDISELIESVKISSKDKLWLFGFILMLVVLDHFTSGTSQYFVTIMALIMMVGLIMGKMNKTHSALKEIHKTLNERVT